MLNGEWYAQDSSKSFQAILRVDEDNYELEIEDRLIQGKKETLNVSSRLGNTKRKITLDDGSIFLTSDNEYVDYTFTNSSFLHNFESKIIWVFLAIIFTLLAGYSFFKWGIPFVSQKIAISLPHKTNEIISKSTLEILDKYMLKESTLSVEKKEKIRTHFHSDILKLEPSKNEINYKLHFRNLSEGNFSIPNAFALPSGDIILTDKFVELCESESEMDSVLLHEMGHVVHRHTLKMLVESTFIGLSLMLIVGDTSTLGDLGIGLSSLLVNSNYSRGHESEADTYAFKKMLHAKMDPKAFSDIMARMSLYMDSKSSTKKENKKSTLENEDSLSGYLSSHPSTTQRINIALKYSECFKKGLSTCKIKEDD